MIRCVGILAERVWIHRKKIAVAMVVAILIVLIVPVVRTPDLFRSRGVFWLVSVEEPMNVGAVAGTMRIFSAEVEKILGIPVNGWTIRTAQSDRILNYTSQFGKSGNTIGTGSIEVPVFFLLGGGWDPTTHGPIGARGERSPFYTLWWGLGLRTEIEIYGNFTSCCFNNQIGALLHEFGHNLGLMDYYEGNPNGILGCEHLRTIMAGNYSLLPSRRDVTGEVISSTTTFNISEGPFLRILDTYFDDELNLLTRAFRNYYSNATGIEVRYENATWNLGEYHTLWTIEEELYLGTHSNSTQSCSGEGLPLPPSGYNFEPSVAVVLALCLAAATSILFVRLPPSPDDRMRKSAVARLRILLMITFAEATVGVVSKGTGMLAIPPFLDWGTAVDGFLLGLGSCVLLLSWRKRR